jgi:hypothetical protein
MLPMKLTTAPMTRAPGTISKSHPYPIVLSFVSTLTFVTQINRRILNPALPAH